MISQSALDRGGGEMLSAAALHLRNRTAELTRRKWLSSKGASQCRHTEGSWIAEATSAGGIQSGLSTRGIAGAIRYVDVFRGISEYAESESSRIQFSDCDQWIVTRPCPTRNAVQDLVLSLLYTIDHVDPYHGNEQYARYHNAMVLYTFLFQAYSIGTRAVNSPIVDLSRVAKDGFVWVDDKDTGSHYNAHLAFELESQDVVAFCRSVLKRVGGSKENR